MKKYSWIVALLAALSLVVIGCDTGGGGGKKDNTKKEIETGEGIAGVWDWSTANDSTPNATVSLELKKPPYQTATASEEFPQNNFGGVSTISGTQDTVDPTIMRPAETKVTGPAGTEVTAFNFTGIVKVINDDREPTEGASYPQVGWEAVPDADTLAKLRGAWAYSFYIKVNTGSIKRNSSANAADKWIFKTVVCAEDFAKEQGHEYKHYFGNAAAPKALTDAGSQPRAHYTKDLALGEWHKIVVVIDSTNAGYNIDQDAHIYQWNPKFKADFNLATATKLQWQIALQDQDGISDRGSDPYDIPNGIFDYNVDFYGLELYLPE